MSSPCYIHVITAYCDNMYIMLIKCCLSGETSKVIMVCVFVLFVVSNVVS